MAVVGHDVVVRCVDDACLFADELPLAVVDDVLYDEPPTILLATVDKFARLQFEPRAGRLLGIGTVSKQPSLVIQDELHLLSGPLGTTVAVFDAVVQLLLSRDGGSPKIVASTATIRASDEQVKGCTVGKSPCTHHPGSTTTRPSSPGPCGTGKAACTSG
ncbi:hypothetical protein ACU686_20880 [Yinghuangia aomiensis]